MHRSAQPTAGPAGTRGSTQLGATAGTAHSCHCPMLTLILGASSCCVQTAASTGRAASPDSKQEKSRGSSLLNVSLCLQSEQDCTELESSTQQGEKGRLLQDWPLSGGCCSNMLPTGSGQNCSLFQHCRLVSLTAALSCTAMDLENHARAHRHRNTQ